MNQENSIKSGILKVSAGSDVPRKKKPFARNRKDHPAGSVILKAGGEKKKRGIRNNRKVDVII